MTVSIDTFLPHILPDVAGCPRFTALQAVIESAIAFCEESHAWKETLPLIALVDDQHSYAPVLPAGSRVILVTEVWAADRELHPATMSEITDLYPDWQTAQGTPRHYNQQDWQQFRVYPIPKDQVSASLTVRAALAPTRAATTLPDFMADRHFQGIVSGALKRLMLKPGQAWSNPTLAAYYENEFRLACANAKTAIFHDRVQGSARVRPRRFG
jgi:hypothetical protein